MGTIRVSNPGRGKEIFLLERAGRLKSPCSLLFNGCQNSFSGIKRLEREVDHCLHLVTRFKMNRIMSHILHFPSWLVQGQFELF